MHGDVMWVLGRAQGGARQLSAKLKAYLRPKCYAVLLDPAVNAPATVRLNLFQARAALCRVAAAAQDGLLHQGEAYHAWWLPKAGWKRNAARGRCPARPGSPPSTRPAACAQPWSNAC
jgi:hypothetical protein